MTHDPEPPEPRTARQWAESLRIAPVRAGYDEGYNDGLIDLRDKIEAEAASSTGADAPPDITNHPPDCDCPDCRAAFEEGRSVGYWQGVHDGQHRASTGADVPPDVPCQLPCGHTGNHWYDGPSPRPEWDRTIATWPRAATGAGADPVREALSWALDLIVMYDRELIRRGDDPALVYSAIHRDGMQRARAALAAEPGEDQ